MSEKEIFGTGEMNIITLSFAGKDVYGNMMTDNDICSFFTHSRFVIFFNIIYDPTPSAK